MFDFVHSVGAEKIEAWICVITIVCNHISLLSYDCSSKQVNLHSHKLSWMRHMTNLIVYVTKHCSCSSMVLANLWLYAFTIHINH
jgi:hypothetical protein